jgi:TolB-like protein/DNA-binding SARP family transcriptional activator
MADDKKEVGGPRIRLELFGAFRATDVDGREIGPLGRSGTALLAYLALAGARAISRDRLATLLWPDRATEQARHSLRQSLLVARRILDEASGGETVIERDGLLLDRALITSDVEGFEADLARGDSQSVGAALALYRAPLLDGFDSRSSLFEDWLIPERVRLHDKAMAAFERAIADRAAVGAGDDMKALAEHALILEPGHEALHRALIIWHIEQGEREAALRQFEQCRLILKRQLDVEPAAETMGLKERAEAMRARAIEPRPPAQARPPPAPPALLEPALAEEVASAPTPPRHARWRGRRLALAGLLAGCLSLAAGLLLWQAPWAERTNPVTQLALPLPDKPSLAVLPLRAGDTSADLAAIADGITEGINGSLLAVSRMFIISRASILALGVDGANSSTAARRLGVRYLLEGTVRRSDERLRVTAQLSDALSGRLLWSARYERQQGDVFDVQDDIIQQIITALQIVLTEGEQERLRSNSVKRSFAASLRIGEALQALRTLSREGNLKARQLYDKTAALDPTDAGAFEGLGWTHYFDARFHWSPTPEESLAKAAALVKKAIALDPGWGRAYSLLGAIALYNGDLERARSLGEQAIALGPNDSESIGLLANSLTYSGDLNRAESLMREAMRLCPYSPDWYVWNLGRILRLKGDYQGAIKELESRLSDAPGSLAPRIELALALYAAGRMERARQAGAMVLRANPAFSIKAWYAAPRHTDGTVPATEAKILRALGLPD